MQTGPALTSTKAFVVEDATAGILTAISGTISYVDDADSVGDRGEAPVGTETWPGCMVAAASPWRR